MTGREGAPDAAAFEASREASDGDDLSPEAVATLRAHAAAWGVTPRVALTRLCAAADHASAEALAGAVPDDPALRHTYDLVRAKALMRPDGRAAWRAMLRAFLRHVQTTVDPMGLLELDELPASLLVALEDLDRDVVHPGLRPWGLGGAGSTLAVMRVRAYAAAAVERLVACKVPREQARHEVAAVFAGLTPPPGRKPRPEVTPDDLREWRHSILRRDAKAVSPRERGLFDDALELFDGEPPAMVATRLRPLLEGLLPRRR